MISYPHSENNYRGHDFNNPNRPHIGKGCGHCGLNNTPEGHDGCMGTLSGEAGHEVMNACCGHGNPSQAHVQLNHANYEKDPNLYQLKGEEAVEYINEHKSVET